ncbi:putative transmembrane protein [Toxoplasma gondii TgCatPRC2]|uniref:Putative transmembrane protein n=1 Tax=Toxoplasma gondii TgCatPRC2 TaxID=1130821 RepID=A0A151HEL1_TOXGO|nr:putative transmembrane protein [Toxoplasma gondii TgCatPRC2]
MSTLTANGAGAACATPVESAVGSNANQGGVSLDLATAADSAPAMPHEEVGLSKRKSQVHEPLIKAEAQEDDVSVPVGEHSKKEDNDITWVVLALLVSFICPPIGCLAFCLNLRYPEDSRRYYWAVRALEVGSLLSFVYSLVLVALLSDLKLVYTQNDAAYIGVGY